MAVIQTGVTVGGNKKEYQAFTTDSIETYPTNCGAGSAMVVIDQVAKKISYSLYFDGTNWNTI